MEREALAAAFEEDLLNSYRDAKRVCNYQATRFIQMLEDEGGIETARILLSTGSEAQTGLDTLYLCRRLDLSVEAKVLNEGYRSLFDDKIRSIARKRLEDRGFDVNRYLKASDPAI